MNQKDAELIFRWLVRRYDDPSERATSPVFMNGDDDQLRNGDRRQQSKNVGGTSTASINNPPGDRIKIMRRRSPSAEGCRCGDDGQS